MSSASITLSNDSPFHSPVTRKCIYHLHKTKLAVASSDKRNPRECEDCYSPFTASCRLATVNLQLWCCLKSSPVTSSMTAKVSNL
ncbi:TPA: hypothetical protein GF637_00730 [Escherichia coli]|nr:hypothetical protein [Escherichia coli]MDI4501378.1 hypothetical protein [Escherichia coli]RRB41866.1 hypothetical protein EIA32_00205 [Escherichia coli]RRB60512.1 hypothetical protein EIA33_00205 [Escherichia coli]RTL87619.1 hypothetical protein EJ111_07880 [Escherichia coli]